MVGAAVLDDVDEGCCLVVVMGECNNRSDRRGHHIRGKSGSRNVDGVFTDEAGMPRSVPLRLSGEYPFRRTLWPRRPRMQI